MRKPAFSICENNGTADQHLCFHYIVLNPNFKPLAIFSGCTAWFMSDLIGSLEDKFFFHDIAFIGQEYMSHRYVTDIWKQKLTARNPKETIIYLV